MVRRPAVEHESGPHGPGGGGIAGRYGGRRHVLLQSARAQQQRPVARVPVQLMTRTLEIGEKKLIQNLPEDEILIKSFATHAQAKGIVSRKFDNFIWYHSNAWNFLNLRFVFFFKSTVGAKKVGRYICDRNFFPIFVTKRNHRYLTR
jgi:hypothetical protein